MSVANNLEFGQSSKWPKDIVIYTDGASRGNPGPASLGLTVQDSKGQVVYEYAEALGNQTNNYAEYRAVRKALELAVQNAVNSLVLRSDSEFLIKQMKGIYKVKSESIKQLYLDCSELRKKIAKIEFEHVRREFNTRADELANMALD